MIRFACPGCAATFTVDDEKAGKTGKCPSCQSMFTIPSAATPAEAGPPPLPPMPSVDQPPPLPPPVDQPPPLPPPAATGDAPVEVAPCPKCNTRLSVMPGDLGLEVECPNCATTFKAVRPERAEKEKAPAPPAPRESNSYGVRDDVEDDDRPKKRSRRRDDEEDDDDYDDRPRRRSRSRYDDDEDRGNAKPGNVQAVGIMLLIGGIYGLLWSVGIGGIYGVSSLGLCCLWPGWWYQLVWGILAIIRGSNLMGQNPERKSPQTLTIMQIICIINMDVVNCIMGIVCTVLVSQPDALRYFSRRRRR